MAKELKDYLHLYLGCKVQYGKNQYIPEIGSVKKEDECILTASTLGNFLNVPNGICSDIKPILRPLESMTEEEKKSYRIINKNSIPSKNMLPEIRDGNLTNCFLNENDPYLIHWLLSKHLDIFGLIEAGLAISSITK